MELEIGQIMEILPHRQPFLLIDAVEELEPGKRAVARKCVSYNEPYFGGHFPGEPVRPEQVKLSGITERRLMRLIRKCLQKEKDRRFQTAEELEKALQKLWDQSENGVFQHGAKRMEESLVIAVAGSRHGVGTTHIAMGLAAYLQKCGMSAVYEEFNESGAVRQLAECRGARADSCGVFRIWKTPMLPWCFCFPARD